MERMGHFEQVMRFRQGTQLGLYEKKQNAPVDTWLDSEEPRSNRPGEQMGLRRVVASENRV